MSSDMINATAASLLGFLESGPKTGWELTQCIEDSVGNFWNVTRSQVYRELNSLAEAGLVRAGKVGTRDRRPYQITATGRQTFVDWINREPGPDLIRIPLLLTVFFRERVDPERFERYLTMHRARHEQQLEEYSTLRTHLGDVNGGPRDALDLGIAYERAVLEWMDNLASGRS